MIVSQIIDCVAIGYVLIIVNFVTSTFYNESIGKVKKTNNFKCLVVTKLFMTKFTLKIIEAVTGKQTFEELVIGGTGDKHKDSGKGQLTEFEKELEGTTYLSEYKTIIAYMSFVSNLKTLPQNKFKEITPPKEAIKEYEFKSKHLRIYCIQNVGGKIIVLCGEKTGQKKDIVKFRSLKKQYLESLK